MQKDKSLEDKKVSKNGICKDIEHNMETSTDEDTEHKKALTAWHKFYLSTKSSIQRQKDEQRSSDITCGVKRKIPESSSHPPYHISKQQKVVSDDVQKPPAASSNSMKKSSRSDSLGVFVIFRFFMLNTLLTLSQLRLSWTVSLFIVVL